MIFTGQTRCYNSEKIFDSHKRLADKLFENYNIETDFWGHTWADCEVPYNTNDFKYFTVDNQSCIDDWVKRKLFMRGWWHPENDESNNFITNNWGDGQVILDKILENSRKAYGQVWSFWSALHMQTCDPQRSPYDVYFKTRWDVEIFKDNGLMEFFPYCASTTDFQDDSSIEDEGMAGVALFDGRSHARFLGNDVGLTHTWTFVNDTNFIFNQNAFVNMYEQDFRHTLDEVCRHTIRGKSAPSSHDIWTLMFPKNLYARFVLQGDCYGFIRTPEQEEIKKELNQWGI